MNGFIRKMCILKELKKGFSADGAPVGGVVRVEKYGDTLLAQVSLINFAPLTEGEYICVLCDRSGERTIFPLTSHASEYRAEHSPFEPGKGFCALICFIRREAVFLAAGQNGGGTYSLKLLKEGLVPPARVAPPVEREKDDKNGIPMPENKDKFKKEKYDDEAVSEVNYYADGERETDKDMENEDALSASGKEEADGQNVQKNVDDTPEKAFRTFTFCDGQSYYLKVKDELEKLFSEGRRADWLERAVENSEWVELEEGCAVGVVYEELSVRYVAYALPAGEDVPPAGMENAFLVFATKDGLRRRYFVLFQDAATGECVKTEIG